MEGDHKKVGLFDRLVERSLLVSQRFKASVEAIASLAVEVHKLGQVTLRLVEAVTAHEIAIKQLMATSTAVVHNIKENERENAVSLKLPSPKPKGDQGKLN